MADRRRSPRYVFLAPADAQTHMVYEAVLESCDGDRAIVTTTHAATGGDPFVMQFSSPSGELTTCAARVVSGTPVACDSTMRFRLILSVSPVSPDWRSEPVPTL